MKTRDHKIENDEIARTMQRRHLGIFDRATQALAWISRHKHSGTETLQMYFAALCGFGLFMFVPATSAHGTAGGHASEMSEHGNGAHNEHRRSFNPFWSPSI